MCRFRRRLEPAAYDRNGARVDAHESALSTLSPLHDECPRFAFEVLDGVRERLADAKPASPADANQGAASAERGRRRGAGRSTSPPLD